jgi:hypothetical protein
MTVYDAPAIFFSQYPQMHRRQLRHASAAWTGRSPDCLTFFVLRQ